MEKHRGLLSCVHLCVPMAKVFAVTYIFPFVVLAMCIFTAAVFRHDDVNIGLCGDLRHTVPSISSSTGIAPQTYVARAAIGLHSTPRATLGLMYLNLYTVRLRHVTQHAVIVRLLLITWFASYVAEAFLILLAFTVSSFEDYSLHEAAVTTLVFACFSTMTLHTLLYKMTRPESTTELEDKSYKWKKIFLAGEAAAVSGILLAFYIHVTFCLPGAFNVFATCEYITLACNVAFHYTATWDFPRANIMAASLQDGGAISYRNLIDVGVIDASDHNNDTHGFMQNRTDRQTNVRAEAAEGTGVLGKFKPE